MGPIVGIGELLWDVYPDGRKVPGGAPFNFAFHCHQLGHEAAIVSRVGDDDLGWELRDEVKRRGMTDEFVQTDDKHPTGTVRVLIGEDGQPSYRIADDVAWDYLDWMDRFTDLLKLAIAWNYGTLGLRSLASTQTVFRLLDLARRWTATPLFVFDINLRGTYYRPHLIANCIGRATWFKMNEDEFWVLNGLNGNRQDDPEIFLYSLMPYGPAGDRIKIVTRGPNGVDVYSEEAIFYTATQPAAVVDTVGAGDAFTAAMVCLHLEGKPLRDCARFANHYAARVCEHVGATPKIDRAAVERAVFG